MTFFFYLFVFVIGLIIGSFLNCVIFRLKTGQGFLKGQSCCPFCHHVLSWFDLVPVISFIALRRRCRYCQKKISWQYPLVELSSGILFVLALRFNAYDLPALLYYLVIICFLIIIFVYDLKHYIIPDKVIYPAIGLTFLYQLFGIWDFGKQPFGESPLATGDLFRIADLGLGILPAFFLLAIILFSRGQWMGLGDFKLAIFMGLFLGWPYILIALFLAFFIGAIIGITLVIFKAKKLKNKVAFAPFLIIGTFGAFIWGEKIINWYLNFIGL